MSAANQIRSIRSIRWQKTSADNNQIYTILSWRKKNHRI